MQHTTLQAYLDRTNWNQEQFTNDRLEIILAASCLRFLGGLTDLDFMLGLAYEIHKKQKHTMSIPLRYATAILRDLAEELHNNSISSTDKNTIERNIYKVQEILIKRGTCNTTYRPQ